MAWYVVLGLSGFTALFLCGPFVLGVIRYWFVALAFRFLTGRLLSRASMRTFVIVVCIVVLLATAVYGVLVPAHGLVCGAVMLLTLVVIGYAHHS